MKSTILIWFGCFLPPETVKQTRLLSFFNHCNSSFIYVSNGKKGERGEDAIYFRLKSFLSVRSS